MKYEPIPEQDEIIARQVIGAAIEVHRHLGPGFLEVIYSRALAHELQSRGLLVESEMPILVPYKSIQIPGQRLNLLIGGRVIVELSVSKHSHRSIKLKSFPT